LQFYAGTASSVGKPNREKRVPFQIANCKLQILLFSYPHELRKDPSPVLGITVTMSSNLLHVRRPADFAGRPPNPPKSSPPCRDWMAAVVSAIDRPSACALPYRRRSVAPRRCLYDRMGSVGAHEVLLRTHVMTAISGMRATPKWNSFCVCRAAHSRSEARRPLQVHQHFKNHGAGAGRNSSIPLRSSPQPLCAASRPLRLRSGREYFEARSAASSATFWRRRSARTCAWSKLAETTSPSVLRTARPLRDLDHTPQP